MIKQLEGGIFVFQENYIKEILKKCKMFDCNLVKHTTESGMKLSKFEDGEKKDPTLLKSLMGSLKYLI